MSVDVVICSKDRENLCLDQIEQIRQKIPHKQIIVVDGSEIPYRLDEGVNHFNVPNIKLGPARNLGVEHISTSNALMIDDDLIYEKTFYPRLKESLDSAENVVAVSGMVVWGWPHHETMMKLHSNPRRLGHSGGCVLFKTDIIKKIGGYHQDIHLGEDTELYYRLRSHGYEWLRIREPVYHPCSLRAYLKRNIHNPQGIVDIWKSGNANILEILLRRSLRPILMPFYYAWRARDPKVYFLYLASSSIYSFYSWVHLLKGWRRWLE